ncbi:MAG TPA: hypothetical protein VE482_08545, partial [Candidatus Eisenbacteria bacterium]|nr:hypothetical protein [Candidatus Eisenbacteria bacterium]
MRRTTLWLIASLGVLRVVLAPLPAIAQAPPSPLPGGTPPISGTPQMPPQPSLPAPPSPPPMTAPGTQVPVPGVPVPPITITPSTGPDQPPPGTGAIPGAPATMQQLPREYLPAPSGIRPFPTPEETKGKV